MRCSLVEVYQQFRGMNCLHHQSQRACQAASIILCLLTCLAYSSTLKMPAICSCKSLVSFHQIIWHPIPDDSTLLNHCHENLESHIAMFSHHNNVYNMFRPFMAIICAFTFLLYCYFPHTLANVLHVGRLYSIMKPWQQMH
jgi:hypothetical protein